MNLRFASLLASSAALCACTALLGIDSLENVDCVGAGCVDASAAGDDGGSGPVDATAPGDAGPDARHDGGDAASDSGGSHADAGDAASPTLAVSVFASGFGNVPAQTGQAQQHHVVYGTASGRTYFFYVDAADANHLKARSTPDFTSWRDEPTLALPDGHGNEGRNFSVATAVLGGVDVFHVILALHPVSPEAHRSYHARARALTAGALAWNAITLLTDLDQELGFNPVAECDPDVPDVVVTSTGQVLDSTGWQAWPATMCDSDVFAASAVDDGGATWTPGFPSTGDKIFYLPVNGTSNAHSLTALPGGDVLGLFGNGKGAFGQPDNVAWSRSRDAGYAADANADAQSTTWPWLRDISSTAGQQSVNDWASCLTPDGTVHAVRRVETTPDSFEHHRFVGDAWSVAGSVPSASGDRGSGIVLVRLGLKMLLFALAGDGSLQSIEWDGGAWSAAWRTVLPAGPVRGWLSGGGCGGPPTLVWTEGGAGTYQVVGAPVDSLFE